ncbi:hypothetical protein MRX96_043934 [Rhipicephalus microplus]
MPRPSEKHRRSTLLVRAAKDIVASCAERKNVPPSTAAVSALKSLRRPASFKATHLTRDESPLRARSVHVSPRDLAPPVFVCASGPSSAKPELVWKTGRPSEKKFHLGRSHQSGSYQGTLPACLPRFSVACSRGHDGM